MTAETDAAVIVDRLTQEYERAVAALRTALKTFMADGVAPDPALRLNGAFAYPELRIDYPWGSPPNFPPRAYGRLNQPGRYATSIAHPYLFRKYLSEQLRYLIQDYDVTVSVGRSAPSSDW